jgi:hypothetical protein
MKLTTWNMCKDERCTFILRCSGSSYLVAGYLDSSVPVIFRSPNPPQNDSNYSSLLLTLWTQRTTANFELRHCFTTFSDKPFWFVSLFSITNTWEFHYANIGFRRAIPEILAGVSCLTELTEPCLQKLAGINVELANQHYDWLQCWNTPATGHYLKPD